MAGDWTSDTFRWKKHSGGKWVPAENGFPKRKCDVARVTRVMDGRFEGVIEGQADGTFRWKIFNRNGKQISTGMTFDRNDIYTGTDLQIPTGNLEKKIRLRTGPLLGHFL